MPLPSFIGYLLSYLKAFIREVAFDHHFLNLVQQLENHSTVVVDALTVLLILLFDYWFNPYALLNSRIAHRYLYCTLHLTTIMIRMYAYYLQKSLVFVFMILPLIIETVIVIIIYFIILR